MPTAGAPALETEPVASCPVCGTRERTLLHDGLTDRVFGVAPGTWALQRCASCAGAYLDPRPAAAALPAIYASYYTHNAPEVEPQPTGTLMRVRRRLRNGYVDARYGLRLEPAWRAGALAFRLLAPQRAGADRMFRHLPLAGRMLDVGCGNGQFVAYAAAAGWRASGIDVDPAGVEAGRSAGLDLRVALLADVAAEEPGGYDAITLSHVIEHVPDPAALLRAARAALRPGGTIWLATPNLRSAGHEAYGRDWLHLDPPRHLVLFTPGSLRLALEQAGFRDVRAAPAVPEARLLFGLSQAVREGRRPEGAGAPVPRALALRAARADLRNLVRPDRAEEVVLLATA
ncbi:MAG: class I SAM-dependent methyltransferase [Solirubrobacterales bacterium]|nr:class I SAM-dependent methyltransferase [Solirubrobacterales bacterium]